MGFKEVELSPTARLLREAPGVVALLADFYQITLLDPLSAIFFSLFSEGKDVSTVREYLHSEFGIKQEEAARVFNEIFERYRLWFTRFGTYRHHAVRYDPLDFAYEVDLNHHRLARKGLYRLRSPLFITYCPTFQCNLYCRYCYAFNNRTKHSDLISFDRMSEVIEEAGELGVVQINITGGEPFLRSDLIDLIRIASSKGIFVEASSKFYFDETVVKELYDAGLDKIQVSIDSSNPSVQDFLTGVKGSWDHLTENIKLFTKRGIRVQTNTVVTSHNVKDIPSLFELLINLGVDKIHLSKYGRVKGRDCDKYFAATADLAWIVEKIHELEERYRVIASPEDYVDILDIGFKKISLSYTQAKSATQTNGDYLPNIDSRLICGAFRKGLAILPDGKVTGCDRMAGLCEELIVGDLKHQGLQEIWDSPKSNAAAFPSSEKFKGTSCYSCERFGTCLERGFCYVRASVAFDRPYAPRPYCEYAKESQRLKERLV